MDYQKPRIVLVHRKTPLEQLLDRYGTHAQARFYLESRGQTTAYYEEGHDRFRAALARVEEGIPQDQRRVHVDRDDLDRFIFAPDDVIVIVGQDGLVPNAAKYLTGQVAIGINPDPERYDGILCPHRPDALPLLLAWLASPPAKNPPYAMQRRTMALAERENGQRLLSLNEVFVGHRTHQSAKYRIRYRGKEERHSSSGVICSTGTGSTGWTKSIVRLRPPPFALPAPTDRRLAWFVREPWPSVATGTAIEMGLLEPGETLDIVSEMGENGVIFADGIESDRIEFLQGQTVRVRLAEETLNLVVPHVVYGPGVKPPPQAPPAATAAGAPAAALPTTRPATQAPKAPTVAPSRTMDA